MERNSNNPYLVLALSIVLQARNDYIAVFKKYINGNHRKNILDEKKELEEWFHSDQFLFYMSFTDRFKDPETYIRDMKKEAYRS